MSDCDPTDLAEVRIYFRFALAIFFMGLSIFLLGAALFADFALLPPFEECFKATWAAARRAIGTRNGEQDT